MNIFRRPDYQSEATLFLNELIAARPALKSDQRAGLNLLWDKPVDRSAWVEYREAQVAQKPYPYQTDAK
jgi:hypothetical protein